MRTTPIFRHLHRACFTLLALALTPMLAVAEASNLEDAAKLEALAKSEAALQFPKLTERQRFLVGPIEALALSEK